jgi:hypothetical protein
MVLLEEFIQDEKSEQHLLPHESECSYIKKDQARYADSGISIGSVIVKVVPEPI